VLDTSATEGVNGGEAHS